MKNSCFAAVLLCTSVFAAAAGTISEQKEMEILRHGDKKNIRLEQQIKQAVAPLAQSRGWAVQRGPNIKDDAGVYYAQKGDEDCDGTSACTVMAVYYNNHPECRKMKIYGKTWFSKNEGGSGRDTYFTTHKNVCYQLAVHGRKDGEAVAQAIKTRM